MSRLTRDGTAEPVSRDQILRHARGQGNVHFPCSADHEQDWQPYPVDPYSAICDDHTYIHTDIVKSCLQALPVCSLVNSQGIESPFLCKAPRPSARVLTLRHAPTSRQGLYLCFLSFRTSQTIIVRHKTNRIKTYLKILSLSTNTTYFSLHLSCGMYARVAQSSGHPNTLIGTQTCRYTSSVGITAYKVPRALL